MPSDYSFSYNGASFGNGTALPLLSAVGLEDLPPIRLANQPSPADTGELSGVDLAAGRDITIQLLVIDAAGADFFASLAALQAATAPQGRTTTLPLLFQIPGPSGVSRSRQVFCRPVKRDLAVDVDYAHRYASPAILFHATDPRIYDQTLQSALLTAPTGGTGFSWNLTWDLSWGGGVSPNTAILGNAGNFETRPKATIAGPCTNPVLTNNTTGQTVALNITLVGGDSLVVDFQNRTVVLNGTGDRLSTLAAGSVWWTIPPGGATVSFVSSSATGTCTFTWRSAWL